MWYNLKYKIKNHELAQAEKLFWRTSPKVIHGVSNIYLIYK